MTIAPCLPPQANLAVATAENSALSADLSQACDQVGFLAAAKAAYDEAHGQLGAIVEHLTQLDGACGGLAEFLEGATGRASDSWSLIHLSADAQKVNRRLFCKCCEIV